ncbi:uncharacterized protein LOC121589286 [Anopheles merus]|uniref:Uncharacterized protein n=1 Tax=Anopheles merus TaxID=30066 RepID=A0A182VMW3_ANOME|nr:uncharacterized protein LOC121589286 [Anopheles merus]XP_041763997.1 uncharacterized protein LOC121589286 [Anopheles merus]
MTSYLLTLATVGLLLAATLANSDTQSSGVGTAVFTKLDPAPPTARNASAPAERTNRTTPEEVAKVRPAYTRTELKVSRSLNPDRVQKLNVRSNNGRMVQIIVKKRNGMELPASGSVTSTPSSTTGTTGQWVSHSFSPSPAHSPQVTPARIAGNYRLSADSAPESVDIINAFLEHVNRIERPPRSSFYDEEHGAMKNDRRPVRIKVSDETVQESRVPPPVVISSDPVYMKDGGAVKTTHKRGRSMQEIGADGIPVVHGIRVPDDESDKRQVWRNARVINGELVPYEKGHVPTRLENNGDIYGQLIFAKPIGSGGARSSPGARQRSIGPFTTADNFQPTDGLAKSFGPFSVEDNLHSGASIAVNSAPPRVTGNIGPFSRADNGRPVPNGRLVEYLRKINEEESRKHYPQIVSRANFKEDALADQPPKIQRRMLQNPGNPTYPVSQLYSINGPAAATNQETQELEDTRQPVLQYAHPELGVQPAKSVPPERKPTKAMKKIMNVQDYYSKAAHNDHSPYAIEPAMGSKDYYDPPQPQHVKMPRPPQYENFKGPSTYPYNYGYIRRVKHERPFWAKITDQMREGLQSGISTVQEFTKPVLEPIVEAGQKISKNLGLVRKADEAQDKVGVVVAPATNSIILPALGLMAGGAALGLGAVAVGRFFDMGLLRRSGSELLPFDLDDLEHKRALEAIQQQQQQRYYEQYDAMRMNTGDDYARRSKRSIARNPFEEQGLQDVGRESTSSSRARFEQQLRETDWKNPSCAKLTFCRVMIQQGADDIVLMEKKMYTMLDMMHPALAATLTDHLSEVTDAIRQNDCTRFVCQQQTRS